MNKVKLKGFFFLGFVFILFKLKEGTPPFAGRRPEGMAGCLRRAKTRESENRNSKEDRKGKENKENKCNFIFISSIFDGKFFFLFRLIFKGILF